jgi:hypothetical protein
MTIENLLKVAPPPAEPSAAFGGPWEPIEAQLGVVLPQDYKDFTRLYGLGDVLGFLGVNLPTCKSPYVRLIPEIAQTRHIFHDPEDFPYPLWPKRGGLLVCGRTDFGDYLFWLTRGPPDEWPIVVWGRGFQTIEHFECGLTDFLAGLIDGTIRPKEFPDDLDLVEGEAPFVSAPDTWPE